MKRNIHLVGSMGLEDTPTPMGLRLSLPDR